MPERTEDPPRRVSVVICAHSEERWHDLVSAVRSVEEQTVPALETIVVVDHNADLSHRAQLALPRARVIHNARSQGLSGARNTGALAARGEVVAYLDDDAQAAPDWLETLSAHYRRDRFGGRALLGVGGAVAPRWDERRPAWFPPEFDWVIGCSHSGMPGQVAAVRNLIGCNMSFPRDLLLAAGGFEETLGRVGFVPTGCEETELCIRASARFPGGAIIYDPRAVVFHRVRPERARMGYFLRRCLLEGTSKAQVARQRGRRAALSNESDYARRTLPLGIARALARRGGRSPLSAATIVAGFAATATGYLAGRRPSGAIEDPRLRPPLAAPADHSNNGVPDPDRAPTRAGAAKIGGAKETGP